MTAGRKAREQTKYLVRQVFDGLPEAERSIRKVLAAAKNAGLKVSLSSVQRWMAEWAANPDAPPPPPVPPQAPPPQIEVMPPAVSPIPAPPKDEADLSDLSVAMQEALDPRLRDIARVEKLEQVEEAVRSVAVAIAGRADQIADALLRSDDPRSAIVALQQLAGAMQIIVASKTMVSTAHRNFGEGDMLKGNASKFHAEARRLYEDGRANRAKEIDGEDVTGQDGSYALDALRGRATEGK